MSNQLLNVLIDFKHIRREKDEAWTKMSSIFNSQLPNNYLRTTKSLRKLYENINKKGRGRGEKCILKTGGGEKAYERKNTMDTMELSE